MTDRADPRSKNQYPKSREFSAFLSEYVSTIDRALKSLDSGKCEEVLRVLQKATRDGKKILVAGNGGSSAIADHLTCDWMKGTAVHGKRALSVQSLTSNAALLTAIANDSGYEQTFAAQVEYMGSAGDVLLLISSSGNSPNIIEAAKMARNKELSVIGFSGFAGGELAKLSHHFLHVPIENYGAVEDAHQILMHVFAQLLYLGSTTNAPR